MTSCKDVTFWSLFHSWNVNLYSSSKIKIMYPFGLVKWIVNNFSIFLTAKLSPIKIQVSTRMSTETFSAILKSAKELKSGKKRRKTKVQYKIL